jgi:tetratricopeptide (TPR) repeat protein
MSWEEPHSRFANRLGCGEDRRVLFLTETCAADLVGPLRKRVRVAGRRAVCLGEIGYGSRGWGFLVFEVFINYRTVDARFGAAAIYELLVERFGRSRIFLDNQSMEPGSVYPEQIRVALESMRVLVVLIGPNWLVGAGDGSVPVHRDRDWVRREIRRALERAVPIVPVLLDGVKLPSPESLPADIRGLVHRQTAEVRHRTLGVDVGRLAGRLADLLPGNGSRAVVPCELPAGTARLVGRDVELDVLGRLLNRPADQGIPMAVLSGTAGVGKTALAVWWAHRAEGEFPDGQLYVDLRGFGPGQPVTPMEALSGFLRALGITRPEELTTLAERSARFRTAMTGRRVVVVLDNAHSAQQVEPLLPGGGPSVVLVTSRDVLGELHITHAATLVRLEPLAASAGVTIIATSAQERVDRDRATAARLAALCAGLPLALWIVAERLLSRPLLTLTELAAELDDEHTRLESFSSLTETANVRAVFLWSYRQLDELDAAVFRAIGLGPRRGFDADVIGAVAGRPVTAVARALTSLSRAHLVTELAGGRYTMHDLLRVYATELALEQDDTDSARRRMFDYYLHSAARADLIITPHRTRIPLVGDQGAGRDFPDTATARQWLIEEEPNLVALTRIDEPELDTHRWQLAYVLRTYFYLTKQLDGWVETHVNALDAAQRSGNVRAEALTRNNLGMALTAGNRLEEGLRQFRTAGELCEQVGDGIGLHDSFANIASVLRRQGDPATALAHQRKALAYYRQVGAASRVGITLRSMAGAYLQLRQATDAIRCAQEAVDMATWLSYELDIAQADNTLGQAYWLLNELTLAEIAHRQALETARACESRFEEARALRGLGTVAFAGQRPHEAIRHWRAALAIYQEIGSPLADAVAADLVERHPEIQP